MHVMLSETGKTYVKFGDSGRQIDAGSKCAHRQRCQRLALPVWSHTACATLRTESATGLSETGRLQSLVTALTH